MKKVYMQSEDYKKSSEIEDLVREEERKREEAKKKINDRLIKDHLDFLKKLGNSTKKLYNILEKAHEKGAESLKKLKPNTSKTAPRNPKTTPQNPFSGVTSPFNINTLPPIKKNLKKKGGEGGGAVYDPSSPMSAPVLPPPGVTTPVDVNKLPSKKEPTKPKFYLRSSLEEEEGSEDTLPDFEEGEEKKQEKKKGEEERERGEEDDEEHQPMVQDDTAGRKSGVDEGLSLPDGDMSWSVFGKKWGFGVLQGGIRRPEGEGEGLPDGLPTPVGTKLPSLERELFLFDRLGPKIRPSSPDPAEDRSDWKEGGLTEVENILHERRGGISYVVEGNYASERKDELQKKLVSHNPRSPRSSKGEYPDD